MIIEFIKPPACLDFKNKWTTDSAKKSKEGINFTYNNKNILIPWHNVCAIEENDGK